MTASASSDAALKPAVGAPAVVIRPKRGLALPSPRELWQYRELLYFLAWRDVKVRYAQTLLGSAWAIFQPIALMLVLTFAFRKLANIQTESVAYPVFALAGIVFWTFFSRAVTQGSDSLVANSALLTRIYCPRLLIPIAVIFSGIVDFVLGLAVFVCVGAAYGYYPTWRLALLAPLFLLGLGLAAGITLFLSALNVRFRDIRQGLPFLVQLWLFLSPIAYPLDGGIYALNPLVGIIDAFRWALVGTSVEPLSLLLSGTETVVMLVIGIAYFSRVERTFADLA
jgi:lipopolysaccharide transport system permease protein